MISFFLTILAIIFLLLALPFVLVKVTNDENRKVPRENRAITFYRRYPRLLELRRSISKVDIFKWHRYVVIFCIILAVFNMAAAGYYPAEARVDIVVKSSITLAGTWLASYCLVSVKRGKATLLLNHYQDDEVYRHKEPMHFWFVIASQFCMAIFLLCLS